MYRNETTTTPAGSFRHEQTARPVPHGGGRPNLISRYLPVPMVIGGLLATVMWMGLVAWWVFSFVRWSIG